MLFRHSCTSAKLLQSCPTLCDPMDCSPPGSAVHGILQTAGGCHFLLQEMVPIQGLNLHLFAVFYIGKDGRMCGSSVMSSSFRPYGLWPARLLCPWGFSRQEYWSGLPCPPPRDLHKPGIEPTSLAFPPLAGRFFTTRATWEAPLCTYVHSNLLN